MVLWTKNKKRKNSRTETAEQSRWNGGDAVDSASEGMKRQSSKKNKVSKKKGSTQSRQSKDGSDPLALYREFVRFIQDDMKLGGGPVTFSFASYFREIAKKRDPNASQEDLNNAAKKVYADEKKAGKLDRILEKVKSNLEKKRLLKKEKKQAEKAAAKKNKELSH